MKIINDVIQACSRNNEKDIGSRVWHWFITRISKKGHNVLGVDISNISIDEANKYLKKKMKI